MQVPSWSNAELNDQNVPSSQKIFFSPSMPAQGRVAAVVPSRWIFQILAVVVLFLCGSVAVAFLPFISVSESVTCGEPETTAGNAQAKGAQHTDLKGNSSIEWR